MPLFWISLAFIGGLVAGKYLPGSNNAWLETAAAALICAILFRRLPADSAILSGPRWMAMREQHVFLPPLILVAVLCLGGWWMSRSGPDLEHGHVAAANGQGVYRIVGRLAAPPDIRDKNTQLRIQVEAMTPLNEDGYPVGAPQEAHGLLLALAAGKVEWEYGDRVQIEGAPVTPPEDETFSYRDYLARQGIYTYLTYPRVKRLEHGRGSLLREIYRIRSRALAVIERLFPSPEAPLLAGILLGIETGLPEDLARAFQDTGTAHVIAISGFNIAILAELFQKIFGKLFTRWWATAAAILAISGYTVLVGAAPSVVRAAIMGSLGLVAREIGRRSTAANSLAFTAMLMCLPNPQLPWDASFQLSFMATLGLILYGDRMQNRFTALLERRMAAETAKKIAGPVGEYILMTLAAQALTLPVILYHFQRLSLSSLLANPLILPVQPLVMILSGLAVIAGMVLEPLGHLLAWLAWPLSAYTIRIVELLGAIPGGVLALDEFNLGMVLLLYAAVLAPAVAPRAAQWARSLLRPAVLSTVVGLAAVLLWRAVLALPDGHLRVITLDMNTSQALLVRGAKGEIVLVDGGPSPRLLTEALGRWTSPFDRHLDGVLVNSPQAASVSALIDVLEVYPALQAWWGTDPPEHRTGERLVEFLEAEGTGIHHLAAGEALQFGAGARVDVIAVSPEGSALLLTWERARILIPGGVSPGAIPDEAKSGLSALILSPRDLKETPPEQWLAMSPQLVIATPEEGAFPHGGANWVNTLPGGWVQIETDGERMWVERSQ